MQRSGYYRRIIHKPIDVDAVKLKAAVRHMHDEMHATYGSRRRQAELNAQALLLVAIKSVV